VRRPWFLFALALAAAQGGCQRAPDPGEWRQWRGPGGLGVSAGRNLPTRWSPESPNLAWRTRIPGLGHSSPIVSGGRVFLLSEERQGSEKPSVSKRRVIALSLETGEELWSTEVFTAATGRRHEMNRGTTPTPVTDGKTLWAYFGPVLAALDLDGEILWQREVAPAIIPGASYGPASSPVLTKSAVVVLQDREGKWEGPGWIGAFDRLTGEPIWRDEWDHTCCSYSTPLLMERPGGAELIRYGSVEVVAYDPESGARLWRHEHPSTQTVPSAVGAGRLLVLPGSMHTRTLRLLRLAHSGSKTKVEIIAEHKRGVPEIASPVLVEDLLFTVNRKGIVSCYDAPKGELLWQERLKPGEYVASLVAAEGKIYATSRAGQTSIFAAEAEFRLIAENEIGALVFASPAIAGDCLLLRTRRDIVCVRGGDGAEPA
jgi:outer membrane protein assembly factor BamB